MEPKDVRHELAAVLLNALIALQVRSNREARGWTHAQLARKAGLPVNLVRDMERTESDKDVAALRKVAAAFDLALVVKFGSWTQLQGEFSRTLVGDVACPGFDDDPAFAGSTVGT